MLMLQELALNGSLGLECFITNIIEATGLIMEKAAVSGITKSIKLKALKADAGVDID